ncbi:hypothetical protein DM01DRAFT_1309803 [Hesseltinella vesiculosa]|uniref:Fork-head domain-containing protein n=1 Tax=Hesseltinella vesiculosa TaxID=101127 RepID=A0A1X2G9B1_9FUNG|nr:hypothetical protein DM01DRAFT_1309803 [Hesseltinella vesiculosa]
MSSFPEEGKDMNSKAIQNESTHSNVLKEPSPPALPNIPVVMRHPRIVSSVKQFHSKYQQQQLEQPIVSESFISMVPNASKPARQRRRPPFSYSSLIAQAILESENKRMTLREIYRWIAEKYPSLYNAGDNGWQNTIRHNLSLNQCFIKVDRAELTGQTKGKGGYWTVDPSYMAKFKNGAFARGSSSTLRRPPVITPRATRTTETHVLSSPASAALPSPGSRSISPNSSHSQSSFHPSPVSRPCSPSSLSSASSAVMNIHHLLN